jgi:hypothetical protein
MLNLPIGNCYYRLFCVELYYYPKLLYQPTRTVSRIGNRMNSFPSINQYLSRVKIKIAFALDMYQKRYYYIL